MRRGPTALAVLLLAGPATAGTDFGDLTEEERGIFRAEIRAVLRDNPDLLARARDHGAAPDSATIYREEIDSDLATIGAHAETLFATTRTGFGAGTPERTITLFVAAGCADCAGALRDLGTLVTDHTDLRVELRAFDTSPDTLRVLAAAAANGPQAAADLLEQASGTGEAEGNSATAAKAIAPRLDQDVATARALGLDTAPSYVMADRMLRGRMPAVVLARYLE